MAEVRARLQTWARQPAIRQAICWPSRSAVLINDDGYTVPDDNEQRDQLMRSGCSTLRPLCTLALIAFVGAKKHDK
jgi:hypothetical protein